MNLLKIIMRILFEFFKTLLDIIVLMVLKTATTFSIIIKIIQTANPLKFLFVNAHIYAWVLLIERLYIDCFGPITIKIVHFKYPPGGLTKQIDPDKIFEGKVRYGLVDLGDFGEILHVTTIPYCQRCKTYEVYAFNWESFITHPFSWYFTIVIGLIVLWNLKCNLGVWLENYDIDQIRRAIIRELSYPQFSLVERVLRYFLYEAEKGRLTLKVLKEIDEVLNWAQLTFFVPFIAVTIWLTWAWFWWTLPESWNWFTVYEAEFAQK
jgi:hypothetical protein